MGVLLAAFVYKLLHLWTVFLWDVEYSWFLTQLAHTLYGFAEVFAGVFTEEGEDMAWRLILNRALHHISDVSINWAEDRSLVDLLVLPEMKARALAKALVAPYYMIISYAISLKYWSTLYSTVLREITMSLALALTISPGWGGPILRIFILVNLSILSKREYWALVKKVRQTPLFPARPVLPDRWI